MVKMIRSFGVFSFVAWLSLVSQAQSPTEKPDPSGFTVELLRVALTRPLPADAPPAGGPLNLSDSGFDLTLKLKGPGLSGIKVKEVAFNHLRTRGGQEFVVPTEPSHSVGFSAAPSIGNAESSGLVSLQYPYPIRAADAGRWELSRGEPVPIAEIKLDGLEIAGSLTLLVSDGVETLRTGVLDLTKKAAEPLKLDGYEIRLDGESAMGGGEPLQVNGGNEIPNSQMKVPETRLLAINLRGDVEALADVGMSINGKNLQLFMNGVSPEGSQFGFTKEGDGRGVIELRRRKNPRNLVVPFRFCLTGNEANKPRPNVDVVDPRYSAELIGAVATLPDSTAVMPESWGMPVNSGAGFSLKFLVRGPDIVEVKSMDGVLDVLRTADGRDIRVRDGRITAQVYGQTRNSVHTVELTCPEPLLGELDGVRAAGSVKAVVARDRATLTSELVDLRQPASVKVGEWTLSSRIGTGPPAIGVPLPIASGTVPTPQAIPMSDELQVIVPGNAKQVIKVEVLVDGKPLQSRDHQAGFAAPSIAPVPYFPAMPARTEFSYRPPTAAVPHASPVPAAGPVQQAPAPSLVPMMPPAAAPAVVSASGSAPSVFGMPAPVWRFETPTAPGVIRVTYWKDYREIRIPFSHNMPPVQGK